MTAPSDIPLGIPPFVPVLFSKCFNLIEVGFKYFCMNPYILFSSSYGSGSIMMLRVIWISISSQSMSSTVRSNLNPLGSPVNRL